MNQRIIGLSVATFLSFAVSAQTYQELTANNIRAGFNSGGLNFCQFIPGSPSTVAHAYEVPQGSGIHAAFGNFIWLGGYSGTNLCVAAPGFRTNGSDYFPGPYSSPGGYLIDTVNWDRVWKIRASDITEFINWYNNPSAYPNYTMPTDLRTWPGNGNPFLGQAAQLAPYVDLNGDGHYNPLQGDYPCIKGNESIYYIVNDDRGAHALSGGHKFGIEIHCMAYTYDPNGLNAALSNALNNTIMVNYRIINRNTNSFTSVRVGVWDDFDLGYYGDDFIGCDLNNNLYYVYNGDGFDENAGGAFGYGNYLPAQGTMFLTTPEADPGDEIDNDHDSLIDEPGEQLWMSGFGSWKSNGPNVPAARQAPVTASEYFGYFTGFWRDGSPFTCDTTEGYGGSIPTTFLFPHDTYTNSPCGNVSWTEVGSLNSPGDRRGIGSVGPFSLAAGASFELELAHIWSSSGVANDPVSSVSALHDDAQLIRNYFSTLSPGTCSGLPTGITEMHAINVSVYPIPASSQLHIVCPYRIHHLEVMDILGKSIPVDSNEERSILDLSAFQEGVYLLKVYTDRGLALQRFIKR